VYSLLDTLAMAASGDACHSKPKVSGSSTALSHRSGQGLVGIAEQSAAPTRYRLRVSLLGPTGAMA